MKSRTFMLLLFTAAVTNNTSVAQSTHFLERPIWEGAFVVAPTGGLYDLDGDGDLDIMTAVFWISLWDNADGLGRFAPRDSIATVLTPFGNRSNILVEDFDGDGDLDLLTRGEGELLFFQSA